MTNRIVKLFCYAFRLTADDLAARMRQTESHNDSETPVLFRLNFRHSHGDSGFLSCHTPLRAFLDSSSNRLSDRSRLYFRKERGQIYLWC
jgi:hypothetical protein